MIKLLYIDQPSDVSTLHYILWSAFGSTVYFSANQNWLQLVERSYKTEELVGNFPPFLCLYIYFNCIRLLYIDKPSDISTLHYILWSAFISTVHFSANQDWIQLVERSYKSEEMVGTFPPPLYVSTSILIGLDYYI